MAKEQSHIGATRYALAQCVYQKDLWIIECAGEDCEKALTTENTSAISINDLAQQALARGWAAFEEGPLCPSCQRKRKAAAASAPPA